MKKLTTLFAFFILFGCSKDDPNTIPEENSYHQNPEVAENVVVILEESSNLTSSATQLNNGIYNWSIIHDRHVRPGRGEAACEWK